MKVPVLLQLVLLHQCHCLVSRLGKLCSSDRNCRARSGGEVCGEKGYCVCRDEEALRYDSFKFLMPKCDTGGAFGSSRCSNNESCPRNASCNTNSTCVCHDGHVFFGDQCVPGKPSRVLRSCAKQYGVLLYCNFHDGLLCTEGKCQCFPEYYLNYTNGKCERQSDYLHAHNLTKYRVKPGLYCREDTDCIEGLVCKKFKCACPEECEYDQEEEVCDCGSEDVSLAGPIITGIFLGVLIICFWMAVNYATYIKITDKKNSSREDEAGASYDVSYSNTAAVHTGGPPTDHHNITHVKLPY